MPAPREDRPGQPVYVLEQGTGPGDRAVCARRRIDDLDLLVPPARPTHVEELGVDPLARDPDRFRGRTGADRGGPLVALARGGTILFKAEASAWTPSAVQLQQVWVDPEARQAGNATRGPHPISPKTSLTLEGCWRSRQPAAIRC